MWDVPPVLSVLFESSRYAKNPLWLLAVHLHRSLAQALPPRGADPLAPPAGRPALASRFCITLSGWGCLDADVSAVRVAQQHLGGAPGPADERMLHGGPVRRLEAVRVIGPDQGLDLGVRAVGAIDTEQVRATGRVFQP